jgi:pilus assembly protein CpaB
MKALRIGVGAVAVGAGIIAMMLFLSMQGAPPPEAPAPQAQAPAPQIETEEVLVASKDLKMGATVQPGDLVWTPWPKANLLESLITKTAQPNGLEQFNGSIVRAEVLTGEPVREARLMKADRGFMSVLLQPGFRAVAVEVKASSTAGGFILPNDRVDIMLTRAAPKAGPGGDAYTTETILSNIKVLAINLQISEDKGQPTVIGETATLELSPRQAEAITQAQQLGTVSLALRALADSQPQANATDEGPSGAVRVVRYGVISRVTTRN